MSKTVTIPPYWCELHWYEEADETDTGTAQWFGTHESQWQLAFEEMWHTHIDEDTFMSLRNGAEDAYINNQLADVYCDW